MLMVNFLLLPHPPAGGWVLLLIEEENYSVH
jgi:hypothetical protein